MIGVFWGLLWIGGGLVVLALATLAVPVQVDVVWQSSSPSSSQASSLGRFLVAARWFGGLTPPLNLIDSDRPRKAKKQKKKRTSKRGDAKKKRRNGFAKIWRGGLASPELVMGFLRQIHFDRVVVDADIGLTNPADTGHLYGLLAPFIYAMPASSPISIMVRPDFEKVRFDGEIDAGGRVIPLTLVPSMARFAWRVFGPKRQAHQ